MCVCACTDYLLVPIKISVNLDSNWLPQKKFDALYLMENDFERE